MKNRHAKRTDSNQKEIVNQLRKIGVQCIITNFGSDFPDLLLGWNNNWILAEVKTETTKISRGQMQFLAESVAPVGIIQTFDDAKRLARNPELYALTRKQKESISAFLFNWKGDAMAIEKFKREVLKSQ